MDKKALVVYFSRSNNTKGIAELIQKHVKADVLRIEPVDAYPADYRTCVDQSIIEIRDGYMPPLKPYDVDLNQYDTIYFGSPIWCGTFAPPLLTFIASNDFSGKTIVPFCTHGGGGQGHFTEDVKARFSDSTVRDTLVLFDDGGRSAAWTVLAWLEQLQT